MNLRVFINYRRTDTKAQASRIYEAFCRVIPKQNICLDVDTIPVGENFETDILDRLNKCDVFLALIGPNWLDALDPKTHTRRLDNPDDPVRWEMREALARKMPLVPVLINRTPMPHAELLPEDIKQLTKQQGETVQNSTFDKDVGRLIRKLEENEAKSFFKRAINVHNMAIQIPRLEAGEIHITVDLFNGNSDDIYLKGIKPIFDSAIC
jgi:TIR domain-containing protein